MDDEPRFADSPGNSVLSPAARARILSYASPPVRGLTGGYILVARRAGSYPFFMSHPRFADSPGDSVLSPAARARILSYASPPVRGLTGGYILVARRAGSDGSEPGPYLLALG
ncbi:MAG TPA: hypothetical protein VKM94_17135 [Blastocatellia bacterium]|nr:hypothetical protein [Blastocatellia bacterium]